MARVWSELQPQGAVLSVCGALVIFFSWVVNNTVQERFNASMAVADKLRESSELFQRVQDIASSLGFVTTISVTMWRDVTRTLEQLLPGTDRAEHEKGFQLQQSSLVVLMSKFEASQIDHFITLSGLALRAAGDAETQPTRKLRRVEADMTKLRDAKNEKIAAAENAIRRGDSVPEIHLEGLRDIIGQFPPLMHRAVDDANSLRAEQERKTDRLRHYARWTRRVSLTMYGVGSLLVIAGTALKDL